MPNWKDKNKRYGSDEVVSSEIRLGEFRLSIHRHIDYPPDTWLASCPSLFSRVDLKPKEIAQAKCQAKAKVQAILEAAISDILSEA